MFNCQNMTLTAAAEMCVTDINYCITLIKNSLHCMPKFAASVNVSRVHPVHCLVIIPISLLPSAEKTCMLRKKQFNFFSPRGC